MQIFITTNSPGEILGWVKPLVKKLKQKKREVKIVVVILPCQYAGGREEKVVHSLQEIDYVINPKEYSKYILWGIKPSGITLEKRGVIVFLGGDPLHALLLSKRLKFPAVAYIQKPRWKNYFAKFMVIDEGIKKKFLEKGIKPQQVRVVGDLMADTLELQIPKEKIYKLWHLNREDFIISLMPGSRLYQTKYLIPFFLRVGEIIKSRFPYSQFLLPLSPFIPVEEVKKLAENPSSKFLEGTEFKFKKEKDKIKLKSKEGLEVLVITTNQYDALNISDLLLTIPGTNTAQAGFLGIPMVVIIPLNKPELIPLDGWPGLVEKIIPFGSLLKRALVKKYSKTLCFAALPNRKANKKIVPELKGIIKAKEVAQEAIKLLENSSQREEISYKLKEIMGGKGASNKMVNVIYQVMEEKEIER